MYFLLAPPILRVPPISKGLRQVTQGILTGEWGMQGMCSNGMCKLVLEWVYSHAVKGVHLCPIILVKVLGCVVLKGKGGCWVWF